MYFCGKFQRDMIEKPPFVDAEKLAEVLWKEPSDELRRIIENINDDYAPWSSVKYKKTPQGVTCDDLWALVKAERYKTYQPVWKKYGIGFSLTNHMQRQCHDFDMNFGGTWASNSVIPNVKERYLVGSLMEEAIASSQMEGASTTRKVAKEMLRKKTSPKGKSQQMIYNNYQTINFIVGKKDEDLTVELLLEVHKLMTENTLDNPDDAGRFRANDDVVVENGITHEVVHTPPTFGEIPGFIDELCAFFNEKDAQTFIHPIIRGIIIHFMISYVHPFADGNGRTARALFYWYMLKQGYWLTEYLSISRIIARSKKSYEKSFLNAESDGNDIGYFIAYNLHVLEQAYNDLQQYIKRKMDEKKAARSLLRIGGINERQAEIINIFYDNPAEVITVKDLQERFGITATTAKTDVNGLLSMSILNEISFNKVKKGYVKGDKFDETVNFQ